MRRKREVEMKKEKGNEDETYGRERKWRKAREDNKKQKISK